MMGRCGDYGAFAPPQLAGDAEEAIGDFTSALVVIANGDRRRKYPTRPSSGFAMDRPAHTARPPQAGVELYIRPRPPHKTKTEARAGVLQRLISPAVATE